MLKNNKMTKTTSQNKSVFVVILVMAILLVIAIGIILFMLLSNNSAGNTSDTGRSDLSENGYNASSDKSQPSQDYGKSNPIIRIAGTTTPVLTDEDEEGVFTQKAEVKMYCDLQDGYEISSTSGKAYKGNKPTNSQMDYENSQNYHKYSQYGSVGLICTGNGKYRKSDRWELQAALGHGVTIIGDDAVDDGRFTFTVEAWLNADGSTKESRDFAKKVLMIRSNKDTGLPTILERYYMEMKFVLNREAQDFLDSWRKTIDAR